MLEPLSAFYHRHHPYSAASLFLGGFLFDTLAVGRIDQVHNVVHQASYLGLCGWLTGLEVRGVYGAFSPPPRAAAAWRYRDGAVHFMLGTLLNIYTLFYFKSASLVVSLAFLAGLLALLLVNELKPGQGSGTTVRMGLLSLCLLSYLSYLVPMLAGRLGTWVFLGSVALAALVWAGLWQWLRLGLGGRVQSAQALRRHVVIPFACVSAGFAGLYFANILPPVPLSLSKIGVYHTVRREGGRFALGMTRPRWKFWQKGDQAFLARPGDRIHCYVRVFSPTRFRERLNLRWLHKDPRAGWQEADSIPLEITGGRAEGWRGFTAKARYQPGRWQVRVETSDGRELGRLKFTVLPDAGREPRAERILYD